MKRRAQFVVTVLGLAAIFPAAVIADEPARPGALVIVGGGGMPDPVRERFIGLAGGKNARVVVVPTASESADVAAEHEDFLKPWRKYAPASLTLLHTRSREKANDPAFVKPLEEATAVWFSGGDQSRLTQAYRGTAAEAAFKGVLKRGGVVGGTSAGAAVISDVMIEGGNPKAEVGRGFGFLTSVVVDQHFLRRSRMNRLLGVVTERPELVGVGIDESTAFVVEGDRWSVVGDSFVLAVEAGKDGRPPRIESFGPGDRGTLPAKGMPVRSRAGRN